MCDRHGGHEERGSALLLFPAGVLILLIFAALAFDVALAHQTKRQLLDVAGSAANDAVTYGLDEAHFRATDAYCVDPDRVRRAVGATVAASGIVITSVEIDVDDRCSGSVAVRLGAEAPAPFGGSLPGAARSLQVRAEQRADVRER